MIKKNELDKILKQIEQSIPLVEFLCEHPNIPNLTLYEKIKQENENLSETQVRNFIREYSEEHRFRILPDAMFDYEWLPDEEGLKPKEVLEIMRNYSKRLSDLSSTETNLQTKIDCSIYAEQYLDILEEIAYLFNNKSLATDSLTYFENNFNYGKTIYTWYDKVVLGAGSQEERWKEFDLYCNNFTDELGLKKDIDGFGVVDSLPYAMIFYENLAYDKNELKKLATNRKSAKEDYPPEDKPWQKKMREYYGDKPDETDET